MGLTRWNPITPQGEDYAVCIIDPSGDFYDAGAVDALLARIRAAVEAEREATVADAGGFRSGTGGSLAAVYKARAALDALLAGGDA